MTKFKNIMVYIFLIVASIISVFPFYWMLSAATNTSLEVIRGKLVPGTYLMQNVNNLLSNYDLKSAMTNSFVYAVAQTLISVFICSLAGYGFEVYHDKAKDRLMTIILSAMMVPFIAIMIPLYQMFAKANLLNSVWGFVLPSLATPLLIMMFRQAARSFPKDIIEAARLEGLNEFEIFIKMFIPTMRSTYAAALTITFMNAWNNYLWPKVIMTTGNSITMPMLVANLKEGYVTDYGVLMVAVFLCTLPTAVIFFLLQKSFAEGITGAVK